MKARLEQAIERYGQIVSLTPRDGREPLEIRAFVQPLLKELAEPPVAVTPLGPVSEHRWLYIGRADVEIMVGDRISCRRMRLAVQEVRPVYWRDEVLYQRAILRWEKETAA